MPVLEMTGQLQGTPKRPDPRRVNPKHNTDPGSTSPNRAEPTLTDPPALWASGGGYGGLQWGTQPVV